MLALGWAEQQLKVELPIINGKIDIACFRRPWVNEPRECMLIVETKGYNSGLDYAPAQAQAYAQQFPECQVAVVTNGYCYKSYLRNDGAFNEKPDAYLNLLNPTTRYPVDPITTDGAMGLLHWLLPHQHH